MSYKNRDKEKECGALSARRRYYKNRNECLELLGGKCSCGFSDIRALNIDHVDGGGCKEYVVFGRGTRYYKKIKELIENGSKKYQILCANCNQIKRTVNNETQRKYK